MRIIQHRTSAAMKAPLPFAGLGFDLDEVQGAALMMTPEFHGRVVDAGVSLPAVDCVAQPSGYSLLVALSREIRGR